MRGVLSLSTLPFDIERLKSVFALKGGFECFETLNNGHINSTYVLVFSENGLQKKYILQKINTYIFKDPESLMHNIVGVTSHLRKRLAAAGKDPTRGTLTFLSCADGSNFFRDESDGCWRMYHYIDKVYTCNVIDSEEVFFNAGKAFGEFQRQLADYPMDTLKETIPNFHNTYSRFLDFKKAVDDNAAGRADNVRDLIDFALAREADTHILLDLTEKGELPLRVTHNDTKLNNILFDKKTDSSICIIDLDTVMPGLSLYDFGDSIRFGANTAAEDEPDTSKVSLSLPLYKAYVEGYLLAAKTSLIAREIEYLPFSAKLMTYECGIRFLGDYLNGDVYFKTAYPEHNLVRAKTQFALVADIEKKLDEMQKITAAAAR